MRSQGEESQSQKRRDISYWKEIKRALQENRTSKKDVGVNRNRNRLLDSNGRVSCMSISAIGTIDTISSLGFLS